MKSLFLFQALNKNFISAVKGYHLVNNTPIKEAVWEHINTLALKESGYTVASVSGGSHSPGCDIDCSLGRLSNKSAKYDDDERTSFKISSYRLTTVCSDANVGSVEELVKAINAKKNFSHYSVLVRSKKETNFDYDWYLFPADHPAFDPAAFIWHPSFGTKGKKKGMQVGWKTNEVDGSSMSVSFSMSSQLWLAVFLTEQMKQAFLIGTVSCGPAIMDYITLHKQLTEC